ncbi:hydroxyacid dehydrogenase [Candidatus Woesearchaeota archaeon]|nr:hydroxyacid dehydrogenase [Candidatus Woesearchaeota archaeon]
MKIAFFELELWEQAYFQERLKGHKLFFFNHELTDKDLGKIKGFDVIGCFIYSHLTADRINQLPKLRLIATMSTGFDHIDLEVCKQRKIIVCNVPSYGENTVAEHTFALILALSRKIVDSVGRTKQDDFSLHGLRGFDLKGKTIGIIGPGHIGQHVMRIARGFEMDCIAYSHHHDKKLAKLFQFKYVTLDFLLQNSDIITIHCPLTSETKHLLNIQNIKKIKKGAYLINTARGDIVETKALMYALEHKILAGAGIDVLEGESSLKEEKELLHKQFVEKRDLELVLENHALLREHNVIITPHNAFNSKEALMRILDVTIENIQGVIKKRIRNQVKTN